MRMWKVDPKLLCKKHLLGEHVEMHMFVGSLNRGIKHYGYVAQGLVEVHRIKERHDALVTEMTRRGIDHKTPLKYEEMHFDYYKYIGYVSEEFNLWELSRRCFNCRDNIEKALLTKRVLVLEETRQRVLLDFIRTMNLFREAS